MTRSSFSTVLRSIGLASALAMLFVLLTQSGLYAQSTGTVTGTVYDQAGAVVPNASVELVNDGTGDTRKSTSNSAGYFSFGTVQPGNYSVKVTASGFKGWKRSGIPVRPGDLRDVSNVSLQVGSQGETVQVEAIAEEIAPVDSGEKSSVLTSKQIENLSLEGRDATELIRTLPGFSAFNGGSVNNQGPDFTTISPTGGAVGEGVVAGGSPYRGGTDLVSDGAHIIDNGCNCGATQTVNGDMVSEVKVQTSNFGADSAKGPVVVNAIGKSGSSSYHGEAYLHARDNGINSLDWSFKHQMLSSPPGLVSPPAGRYLFPGGQIGGPVPGTHKKLVFWAGFEYYYQHGFPLGGITVPGLMTDSVPTASMRNGDFSSTAADNNALCGGNGIKGYQPVCANLGSSLSWFNTTTNLPGTGTTLPSNLISDPGVLALMKNIPMPNADPTKTGGYNLLLPENLDQNGFMFRTRVDYAITDSSKVYATYNNQKETDDWPIHLWWNPANSVNFPGGMTTHDNSRTITGHFLHVFSPTLTNDVASTLAYITYPLVKNSANGWSAASNGYPYGGVFATNNSKMMPDLGNGYWLAGVPQMIQPDIFQNNQNYVWQKWNYTAEDNLTKSYKTHTIKAGFYWEKTTNNQGAFTDYNGHFEATQGGPFNGCNNTSGPNALSCGSNNPVANLLLGVFNYDQVNKRALDNVFYPTYSGYAQDDWKFNRRLTLNLGLRADHLGAWRTPVANGVATWTGNLAAGGPVPGFSWHGVNPSIPLTGRDVPVLTWQPRLGFAYDLRGNGKTVLRGGWGEYGFRDQLNDYSSSIETAEGTATFNASTVVTPAYIGSIAGTIPVNAGGSAFGLSLTDHVQPVSRNYNFTVSQQMPFSSLLEIGYVGSQTRNSPIEGNSNNLDARNINLVPTGVLFTAAGCSTPLAPTSTQPGTSNPCDIDRNHTPNSAGQLGGFSTSPYPLASTYGASNVQVLTHKGIANYNALQTSWVRQKGRATYNLNYTWSKTLGTLGTAQLNGLGVDALNLSHDYGVLSIDRSHVFNFSYTFQVGNPVKSNKVLEYAANGWNISGITTWQSGPNITSLSSQNLGLGGTGPAYTASDGSVHTYSIAADNYLGTNNSNLMPTVVCDPTYRLQPHQHFNASCFGVAPAGQNGWWQLPYLHGPAYFNSDLSVFKTFKVTERQNVEFRFSGYNFLNHPLDSFQGNGDMSVSFTYTCSVSPCTYGAGHYVLNNGGSGDYTLNGNNVRPGFASTKFGRRVLELSAKYSF